MPEQSQALPSIPWAGDADTERCKTLLGMLPASAYPAGDPKGVWKRSSKSGSAPRVERVFRHPSGLAALVVQTPNELRVESLAASLAELEARSGAAPAAAGPAQSFFESHGRYREVRAERGALAKMARALAKCGGGEDEGEGYWELADKVFATPQGSAERVAFGAMFEFHLPTDGLDEPMFMILAKGGSPSPDHPHRMEDFLGHDLVESPNESCDHWIHLEPADAIGLLLGAGMAYAPPGSGEPEQAPYRDAMRARMEAAKLRESTPAAARPSPRAPSI